jgi:hypothetical protein
VSRTCSATRHVEVSIAELEDLTELLRLSLRLEGAVNIELKAVVYEDVKWPELPHDTVQ